MLTWGGGLVEHEYDHVFVGTTEQSPSPDPAEVSAWKWMDCDELRASLISEPERYTYWLRECYGAVLKRLVS